MRKADLVIGLDLKCCLRVTEAEQSSRLVEGTNWECLNHSLHMEFVACLYNLLNIRKLWCWVRFFHSFKSALTISHFMAEIDSTDKIIFQVYK